MNKHTFEKQINGLYSDALLHIAYASNETGNHMIFALFECYPRELLATEALSDQAKEFGNLTFHYARIKLSAAEAVEVYRGCKDSAQAEIPQADGTSVTIATPSMADYKLWPCFLCAEKNTRDGIPFIPNTWGACRIHQMFPSEQNEELLNQIRDHRAVSDWLKAFLTWDISEFPELTGGICFLLPNPYYRSRNIHLIPGKGNQTDKGDKPDKVKIEFQPRRDMILSSLRLYAIEKTHFGYSLSEPKNMSDVICIPLIGTSEDFSYIVLDENHELIDRTAPAGFWKGFSVSFSLGTAKKRITRPKSGKIDEVNVYDEIDSIEAGGEYEILQKRFDHAAVRRIKKEELEKSGFKIFYNDHGGAEDFLRGKIREARKSVMIAAPYISSEEVFAYAMATERRNVSVTVLTGNERLTKEFAPPRAAGTSRRKIKDIDAMKEGIKQYREQKAGNIKVFIMKRKPYPIHDRFLVVDEDVWFCGSSLHLIGERMSCVMRIPNGDEIKQYLDNLLYSNEVEMLKIAGGCETDEG